MWSSYVVVTLVFSVVLLGVAQASLPLPPYIKPCALDNPNFNECALASARKVIPQVINGDRKYKIPPMNPLIIEKVKVADGGPKHAGLTLILNNATIHGFKDVEVLKTDFDFNKRFIHYELHLPRLEVLGQYEVSGRVLLLPITGSGDINMTLSEYSHHVTREPCIASPHYNPLCSVAVNVGVVFDHGFNMSVIDGQRHMIPVNPETKVTTSRLYIHQTNLFNGDKVLGEQMNQFLNENWKTVFADMAPTVVAVFNDIVMSTAKSLDDAIPFDVTFPKTLPA